MFTTSCVLFCDIIQSKEGFGIILSDRSFSLVSEVYGPESWIDSDTVFLFTGSRVLCASIDKCSLKVELILAQYGKLVY